MPNIRDVILTIKVSTSMPVETLRRLRRIEVGEEWENLDVGYADEDRIVQVQANVVRQPEAKAAWDAKNLADLRKWPSWKLRASGAPAAIVKQAVAREAKAAKARGRK